MPAPRTRLLRAALVLLPLALAAALLPSALTGTRLTTTAYAADPVATATPGEGLDDGQFVSVAWSGFPAGTSVVLRQCPGASTTAGDCTSSLVNGFTRDDGSGRQLLEVKTGRLEERFTCSFSNSCTIGVFTDGSGTPATAFAPLAFAFPADACPTPTGVTVGLSGASAAARAMGRLQGRACQEPLKLSVDFTTKNSPDGRRDYLSELSPAIITANPFTAAELAQAETAGRPVGYAPLTLSGLSFGYRLRDRRTGEAITDLKLTPELTAQIFTGQVLEWTDQRVRDLNPGKAFPSFVKAVGRADGSAATELMTTWFESTARAAYRAGGSAYDGVTETYPSTGDIDLRTGAAGVAAQVARPSTDTDPDSFGYIGLVDSSTAALYGLSTARLVNAVGEAIAPTPESLVKAAEAMTVAADGSTSVDFATTVPGAYPLPVVSMVAAPVKGMVPAEAKVLQSFLRFAVGDGQDALPDGYAPLPQAFRTRALATAGRLDAAKPAASPSPIPSGTAAPPVVPDDGGEAPVLDPGSDGLGDGGSGGGGNDLGGSGGGVDLTDGAVDGDVVTVAPGALPPVAQAPQVAGGPAQVALAASLVPASRARTLIPLLVGLTLLTLLGGPAMSLLATRRRPTSAGA